MELKRTEMPSTEGGWKWQQTLKVNDKKHKKTVMIPQVCLKSKFLSPHQKLQHIQHLHVHAAPFSQGEARNSIPAHIFLH